MHRTLSPDLLRNALWLVIIVGASASCVAQPCTDSPSAFYVREVVILDNQGGAPSVMGAARGAAIGICFESLDELRQSVKDAYQKFGYFAAKVSDANIKVTDGHQKPVKVLVTIAVDAGPKFRLGSVRWENAKVFTAEELSQYQSIQAGDVFDVAKVRDTLDAVMRLYVSVGRCGIAPIPDAQMRGEQLDLIFTLDEGTPCKRN